VDGTYCRFYTDKLDRAEMHFRSKLHAPLEQESTIEDVMAKLQIGERNSSTAARKRQEQKGKIANCKNTFIAIDKQENLIVGYNDELNQYINNITNINNTDESMNEENVNDMFINYSISTSGKINYVNLQ
jgi:Ca2+-binding EF-hand superfamily protein